MNKIFVQLLKKRGISDNFLTPKYEDLIDPFLLSDMEKAVERIISAKKSGEKILVYGDYDVDGITSTAIVVKTLGLMGIFDVLTMLPDRFVDGYGMSERLVERAKKEGVELVITVDCGSNNAEIIDKLLQAGIQTIVTDHHELPDELLSVGSYGDYWSSSLDTNSPYYAYYLSFFSDYVGWGNDNRCCGRSVRPVCQ